MEFVQDALVQWDKDQSRNVVSLGDVKFRKNSIPRKGTVVKMKWGSRWWRGKILALSEPEHPMELDMDDIPLAQLG